jgi:hypothetical protein
MGERELNMHDRLKVDVPMPYPRLGGAWLKSALLGHLKNSYYSYSEWCVVTARFYVFSDMAAKWRED